MLVNSKGSALIRMWGYLLGKRKREKFNILSEGVSEARLCMKKEVFSPNGSGNEVSISYCQDLSRLKGSKDFIH